MSAVLRRDARPRRSARARLALGIACAGAVGAWMLHPESAGWRTPDADHGRAAMPASRRSMQVALCNPDSLRAMSAADVRAVVRRCSAADLSRLEELRGIALESPDPLVVGNAVRAIGRLGAFRSDDPELGPLLRDPRLRVRQEAVRALGRGDEPAVASLCAMLDDGERAMRPLVVDALGRVGGEAARARLEAIVADPAAAAVERAFAGRGLDRIAAPPANSATRTFVGS